MIENVSKIKAEIETAKNILEKRQNKIPPMCQRITVSVSSLMNHYNRILSLCEIIYELETRCDTAGTIQELVMLRENQKGLTKQIKDLEEELTQLEGVLH